MITYLRNSTAGGSMCRNKWGQEKKRVSTQNFEFPKKLRVVSPWEEIKAIITCHPRRSQSLLIIHKLLLFVMKILTIKIFMVMKSVFWLENKRGWEVVKACAFTLENC